VVNNLSRLAAGCFLLVGRVLFAASTDEPVAGDAAWMRYHEAFLAQAKRGEIDVLFLGDSITDYWRSRAPAIWEREFAPLKAANFGEMPDRLHPSENGYDLWARELREPLRALLQQ
jgi:hypothetical protein